VSGTSYRLPSEAEWEYACRAGTVTPFWWGSSITPYQANYAGSRDPYEGGGNKGEFRKRTVPARSFEANPWGLYQVHGNVWQWCQDCWNDNYKGAPRDGTPWNVGDCSCHVLRGGCWVYSPEDLRSACRFRNVSDNRYYGFGFRVARTLNP
jgi:formylglycine-generating enzyme required for sulfatase activity